MSKFMGQPIKRVEDPRFIQGQGKYVANIKLPDMAFAAVKRSPYAHATIDNIDASEALAMDGVLAVYTGQDIQGAGIGPIPCGFTPPDIKLPPWHALSVDKARHVGDAVAVVVAESAYIAYDALDAIEVDYTPLDAVVDAKKATEPGAPQVHEETPNNTSFHWPLGDSDAVKAALDASDHVVELDLINQRLIPNAMEPRACVADWSDAMDEMVVWTTSQNPHVIRLLMSAFTLQIPENKLRVISPDVGGGFGSKIFHYPEEIIVPFCSMQLKRPVKWVSSRSEAFLTDAHGRDHVTTAKLGVNNDGEFTAFHVQTWANMGAYLSAFAPMIPTALYITLFAGLYKTPLIFGESFGTMTNTTQVDAYRGAGRPEASYLLERIIDIAARDLNMDPIEIRRKNFIRKDEYPYQTPVALVYDSGDYDQLFDKAMEVAGYNDMLAARDAARAEGRLVGVGVSGCIEASGAGPSKVVTSLGAAVGLWEHGSVRVHPTGKISVMTGAHTHGQGHETTFAQIVAEELGVPIADIEIIHGDTAKTPFGLGTYASRSAAVGGSAILKSAIKVKEKMKAIAAYQLEAAVEDIVYDAETASMHVKGSPDNSKSFFEISFSALTHNMPDDMEPGLEEHTFFDPPNFTFPNSAHIAMIEIDKDTGEVSLLKYAAVDDVGNVINPMIVEGQLQGGIAQGVGQALLEHGQYDDDGQLLTGSFLDYAMPRADNLPMSNLGRIEIPSPSNPLGVKGAGEMGTIAGTPTVANAVMDALQPMGVRHVEIPHTPLAIHTAIQNAAAAAD